MSTEYGDMKWFVFMVASLAVFRVSELIVYDKIFGWFRGLCEPVKFLNDLTTCIYCASVWIAGLATIYAHYLGYAEWPQAFGYWVGLSGSSVVIYRAIRERS